MSARKNPNRVYTATADELNEAIGLVLKEKKGAEWKEVRFQLMQEHKDWVLPERRIAKFVKRQRLGEPISADDEESIVGRSLFSRMSSKSPHSVASVGTAKTEDTPMPEPVLTPEEPKAKEEVAEVPPPTHQDDNDGAEEPSLCAGCVVM